MAETVKIAELQMDDNKVLTLAQRLVKIREEIPNISKKKHSDGVKYKFVKIDEVYALATPAMNKHGVNFAIVNEVATMRDENGSARYWTTWTQSLKSGGERTVFVYEADLTCRWQNADVPDEVEEFTIHAIGTNDGGPDKAKGSAWTYALKYYFFEKFGIDQGEDDPDTFAGDYYTPRPAQKQKPKPAPKPAPKPQPAKPLRTADDCTEVFMHGELCGFTETAMRARCVAKYGADFEYITAEQFAEISATMSDKANKEIEQNNEEEVKNGN